MDAVLWGIIVLLALVVAFFLYKFWRAKKILQDLKIANWQPGDDERRKEQTKR